MADENRVQLGRVVPNYLGDWSSTKSYSKLDSVVYNSVGYIANKDVAAGVVPGTDSASWSVTNRGAIGPKGDKGDKGDQGIQGPMGPQGERGKQIFKSSAEYYEPASSGHWWSDLSPTVSSDNPPKVGDTIINSSGNIFQINTVNAGDGGGGGGTFGVGVVLGNITGPQGPKGDMDLSQITVGGRNLLLGTGRSFTGVGNNSTAGNFDAQGGKYYLAGGKTLADLYKQYGSSGYLTLSFDWVASGSTLSGRFNPQWGGSPYGGISASGAIFPSSTNTSGHYITLVPLNQSGYSTGTATSVQFRQDNLQGNVAISNVKLEVGNIATDWTPAPEDADNAYVKDTRLASGITDFNLVMGKTWSGKWYKVGGHWSNEPGEASQYLQFEYTPGDTDKSGILEIRDWTSNRHWVRTVSSGTWSNWVEVANDANVVHKTGNETVVGDKTFTGNTTMANIKSSSIKTANVTMGLLTLHFQQTAVGVNVYVDGTWSGTFSMSDSYISSGISIPSVISKPQLPVVLNIISNGGIGGVTTNSPFKLEVLIDTDGVIKYRAKTLRDNDTTARNSSIVGADSTFYAVG